MPKSKEASEEVVQEIKLTQNKVCKNCVRFGTTEAGAATSSIYLNNSAHKALGSPKEIKVTVEAVPGK
jgi:hypothetical protein